MGRDHRKLRAFEMADELVVPIYEFTRGLPSEEKYGLSSQIRRAAVSVCANLVEGSSRTTEKEYARFVDISFGSASETMYLLSIASRLGYTGAAELEAKYTEVVKTLNGLVTYLRSEVIR